MKFLFLIILALSAVGCSSSQSSNRDPASESSQEEDLQHQRFQGVFDKQD